MSMERQTAHSVRYPEKPVQPARGRPPIGRLSDAEKATRELAAAKRKAARDAFQADVNALRQTQNEGICEIAQKHSRTEQHVRNLVLCKSQYGSVRAPSLRNAITHRITEDAKADGRRLQPKELQKLVSEQMERERSVEEEEELLEALAAHRELRSTGLRGTNTGSAVDARRLATKFQTELAHLFERTGTRGFALLTRGDIDDAFLPTLAHSGEATRFFLEVLKIPAVDVLRLFEQWAVTQDCADNMHPKRGLRAVRSECSKLLDTCLQDTVKNDEAKMVYKYYKSDVALAWKVKLVGWPSDIPFASPSKIGVMDALRRLRDLLKSNAIYFDPLSPEETRKLEVEVEAERKANGGRLKPRKRRSDAGGQHLRKRHGNANEDSAGDLDEDDEEDDDEDEDEEQERRSREEEEDSDGDSGEGCDYGANVVPLRSVQTDAAARAARAAARSAHIITGPTATEIPLSIIGTRVEGDWDAPALQADSSSQPSVVTPGPITTIVTDAPSPTTSSTAITTAHAEAANAAPDSVSLRFISYSGGGTLANRTNMPAAPKRKADGQGGTTAKKSRKQGDTQMAPAPRKKRSDAGKPRAAGAITKKATASGGGGGRDDEATRAALERLQERSKAARASAALASQLPPRA